jgi:UDP-N-acetylmuramate dehydrogenase
MLRGEMVRAGEQRMIRRDVALYPFVSLRVGGPARFLAEPDSVAALRSLLQWAKQNAHPSVILGVGSNVVFPDSGFAGLVVRTTGLRGCLVEGTRVRAAAGERLAEIAWRATRRGLSGLEWACGIPGSVGGAVVMNAGAQGSDVAAVLESIDVLADDEVRTLPKASLDLGYRTSAFLTGDLRGIVLGAAMALRRDDPGACIERARAAIAERLEKLPVGASAGSVFRNPPAGPTAGELLDRAGCKRLSVGLARVSEKHANVVVNEGTQNARDVLALIDEMRRRVKDTFGVELVEEIVLHL